MANDEHLHKAFAFFDQNQSGFIEIEELRNALNDDVDAGGEEVIHAIMHDVDTDKVRITVLRQLTSKSFILNPKRFYLSRHDWKALF